MAKMMTVLLAGLLIGLSGCSVLRLAPSETEKQNAYLQHRTTEAAAIMTQQENCSDTLKALTSQANRQSDAILAYYGLPKELPAAEIPDDLLSDASNQIAQDALTKASQQTDWWNLTDSLLAIGLAVGGVVGGATGGKTVSVSKTIREKHQALKEIIQGNELYKQQQPDQAAQFKQAQQKQSAATRKIVASVKADQPAWAH